MHKAKFIRGLSCQQPITLKLAISMSNERQTGEDFEAFVELVNRHKGRIEKLEVILSCQLQRHYVGNTKAIQLGDDWITKNQAYLDKLQIPFEIIRWPAIISSEMYLSGFEKINQLYAQDTAYQTIVNNLSKHHAHKADFESAKCYLLEECAAILSLEGHLSYPSQSLNEAISYVLKIFDSPIKFVGYRIDSIEAKNSKDGKQEEDQLLMAYCLSTSVLMNRFGILGVKEQTSFFQKFLEMKESFLLAKYNGNMEVMNDNNAQRSALH